MTTIYSIWNDTTLIGPGTWSVWRELRSGGYHVKDEIIQDGLSIEAAWELLRECQKRQRQIRNASA